METISNSNGTSTGAQDNDTEKRGYVPAVEPIDAFYEAARCAMESEQTAEAGVESLRRSGGLAGMCAYLVESAGLDGLGAARAVLAGLGTAAEEVPGYEEGQLVERVRRAAIFIVSDGPEREPEDAARRFDLDADDDRVMPILGAVWDLLRPVHTDDGEPMPPWVSVFAAARAVAQLDDEGIALSGFRAGVLGYVASRRILRALGGAR